jgi:hypothetical protein
VVAQDVFAGSATYKARALDRQKRAGVGLIRQTFDWANVETRPGRYDLRRLDAFVESTSRRRIAVLPILFNPPPFRSSAPAGGGRRGTYPPARARDLGHFGAVLVRRYGPRGSFWRERPTVPRTPITAWQIWNEPNLPVYWPAGPDAGEYTELLREAAREVKRADPRAEVVSAGLAESRLGIPFRDFVEDMYEAGAGEVIDTFALHPFARTADGVLRAAESTRQLLEQQGSSSPIWITEMGWASGGPDSPFTVGERAQALLLRQALSELGERRRTLGLRGVVVYGWKDLPTYPGGQDFWGLHTGLLRRDGSAKPALAAFREGAQAATR